MRGDMADTLANTEAESLSNNDLHTEPGTSEFTLHRNSTIDYFRMEDHTKYIEIR